jgi:hypothetical protein
VTIVCADKAAARRALAVLSLNGVALRQVSENGPFMGDSPDTNIYLIVNCALTDGCYPYPWWIIRARSEIVIFRIGKRKLNYPPYLIEAPLDHIDQGRSAVHRNLLSSRLMS